jgi:hypothetical protein
MMKKTVLICIVILAGMMAFGQKTTHMKLGAGIAFGDWASIDENWEEDWGMGFNIRMVIYNDNNRFSISPSYINFPVQKVEVTETYLSVPTTIEVDPQIHYLNLEARFSFVKSSKADAFVYLGPSFMFYYEEKSAENHYYEGEDNDGEMKAGAIVGTGVSFNLSKCFGLYVNAGYSYIPDDWDQLLISSGLSLRIF